MNQTELMTSAESDATGRDARIDAIPDTHGHAKGEHKPYAEERPIPYTARMLFLWFYHACRRNSPRYLMVADHMNYLTFEDPAAVNLVRRAIKLASAGDLYGAAETAGVEIQHAAVVSEGLRRGMRYSIGAEVDNDPRSRPDAQNIVDAMKPDGMIRSVHFLPITHPVHGENWMWPFDNPEFVDLFDHVGVEKTWEIYMATLLGAVENLPGHIVGHFYVPAKFGHWPPDDVLEGYEDRLIEAVKARSMAIEINGRTFYRHAPGDEAQLEKFRAANIRLMRKAKAAGVAIAVGSDAHSPKDQGNGMNDVLAMLDEADVNVLAFPINGRIASVALRITEDVLAQQRALAEAAAAAASAAAAERAQRADRGDDDDDESEEGGAAATPPSAAEASAEGAAVLSPAGEGAVAENSETVHAELAPAEAEHASATPAAEPVTAEPAAAKPKKSKAKAAAAKAEVHIEVDPVGTTSLEAAGPATSEVPVVEPEHRDSELEGVAAGHAPEHADREPAAHATEPEHHEAHEPQKPHDGEPQHDETVKQNGAKAKGKTKTRVHAAEPVAEAHAPGHLEPEALEQPANRAEPESGPEPSLAPATAAKPKAIKPAPPAKPVAGAKPAKAAPKAAAAAKATAAKAAAPAKPAASKTAAKAPAKPAAKPAPKAAKPPAKAAKPAPKSAKSAPAKPAAKPAKSKAKTASAKPAAKKAAPKGKPAAKKTPVAKKAAKPAPKAAAKKKAPAARKPVTKAKAKPAAKAPARAKAAKKPLKKASKTRR